MRVLVCGGRGYNDWPVTSRELDKLAAEVGGPGVMTIIHGAAQGADLMAAIWADARGAKIEPYAADWRRWGKSAGPRRNARMLAEGKPDLVVAFPGGFGTADMVRRAREAGVPVREVGR